MDHPFLLGMFMIKANGDAVASQLAVEFSSQFY
jgi:hypothetical protein